MTTPPSPRPSPSPELPLGEIPDTPTGRYRALKAEVRYDKVFTTAAAIIALLISFGSVFGGYRILLSDAKAQTKEQIDAGAEPTNQRLGILEKSLERHLDDAATVNRLQAESNYRAALEVRELQKVILTGRSSEVLNTPPPLPVIKDAGR